MEACLYFCCLQAIQNMRRHAGNAPVLVRLSADPTGIVFEVRDEGPGYDTASTPEGMGLRIIRDRAEALDGELVVESDPTGTLVKGRVRTGALETTPA